MTNIQIEMSIAAVFLLLVIIINLKKNSLSIKNSVAWLLLPVIFIIIAIIPGPLESFARWLGFEALSNFIFLVAIASLIFVCFSLTIITSKQQSQIAKLIQEVSILKSRLNENKSKK